MGRSGSTLLVDLLNQHPHIYCDGEILKKKVLHLASFIEGRRNAFGLGKTYGFRAKLYQATREQKQSFEEFVDQLSVFDVKWIYLHRRDTWKQALSAQVTKQTRIPNARNLEQLSQKPIDIDWQDLKQEWQNREEIKSTERLLLKDFDLLELCYEDDLISVESRQHAINRLFDRLALEPQKVESQLQRLSNVYPKVIRNYEALQQRIAANESN